MGTALEPGLTLIVMADHEGLERLSAGFERATGAAPASVTEGA
jgi:hypothetical protein